MPTAACLSRRIRAVYSVMAMKETEGSLRAYFLLAGGYGVVKATSQIGHFSVVNDILTSRVVLMLWIPTFARLALAIAFIVAGSRLKAVLPTGATWIKDLLLVAIAILVVEAVIVSSIVGPSVGREYLVANLIGLAITVYLIRSVRRLSAEAIARTGPPARVASL